ncbi:MAG: tyrosine-type recombinase/integrase [Planctomycetota bacterium]
MGRKRKPPQLRNKDGCFVADIYTPDGKRTTISFGSADQRTEGEIYAAFGQWLDLYNQQPHKVLSFDSPYDAIQRLINPRAILRVGQFHDKYLQWLSEQLPPLRDGQEPPDLPRLRRLGTFLEWYWEWPVSDFGPDELRAVQQAMVDHRYDKPGHDEPQRYTRTGINQVINQAHRMWSWGVGREITTEAQVRRLKEVKPLRAGRTKAPDKVKRALITDQEFEKVLACVNSVVGDMLRLLWQTAMRPGEVCRMRPIDILRPEEDCWLYVPGRDVSSVGDHKTAYRQRVRAIPLPESCQQVLRPRVTDWESREAVFQPAEAVQEMRDRRFARRKTPAVQGNSVGTNRKADPMIQPGTQYNTSSLNNAAKRACKRAGVERFTPYDLRRTAATRVRARLSKDAASLLLGHVSSNTTEVYLLEEVQEAMKVARQLENAGSR